MFDIIRKFHKEGENVHIFTLVAPILLKAILRDVMGEEKIYFSFASSYIYVHCIMTLLSPYYKPLVYSCWVLCVIWNIVHSMSSHLIPHCKLYQDPDKGKVIADCVITTTPTALIFTGYCLFLMFYRFM